MDAISPLIQTQAGLGAGAPSAAATQHLLGKNRPRTSAEIDKAAMDFEGVFMGQMLEPMFNNSQTQWFGGGESEDVFRSLMVQQFGTLIAKSGGVGIADMVKKQLLTLQEVQKTPEAAPTVK